MKLSIGLGFSKSALGRRSRTGSVALNADRRRLVGVAGLTAFDISPSQSFSNVCSGGWREVGEGVDGNAVWPYTRASQPAAGFDRCVSRSALTPNPTDRFVLAVQVRTAIEGEREGRRESGAKRREASRGRGRGFFSLSSNMPRAHLVAETIDLVSTSHNSDLRSGETTP